MYSKASALPIASSRVCAIICLMSKDKYFTGNPCPQGHISERYKSNGTCIDCQRQRNKDFRKSDAYKETRKEKLANRYSKNPWLFLYHSAKCRAKRRNIIFTITQDDVRQAWPQDGLCPVLGKPLLLRRGEKSWEDLSPSLDRIDSSKGYEPGNIAIISTLANVIKSYVNDPEVFRRIASYIESHLPQSDS